MIHARDDYNAIQDDPRNSLIPDDEPVFLIRAQDEIGWKVVAYWAFLREQEQGENDAMTRMVYDHADAMREWPVKKKADFR